MLHVECNRNHLIYVFFETNIVRSMVHTHTKGATPRRQIRSNTLIINIQTAEIVSGASLGTRVQQSVYE